MKDHNDKNLVMLGSSVWRKTIKCISNATKTLTHDDEARAKRL